MFHFVALYIALLLKSTYIICTSFPWENQIGLSRCGANLKLGRSTVHASTRAISAALLIAEAVKLTYAHRFASYSLFSDPVHPRPLTRNHPNI